MRIPKNIRASATAATAAFLIALSPAAQGQTATDSVLNCATEADMLRLQLERQQMMIKQQSSTLLLERILFMLAVIAAAAIIILILRRNNISRAKKEEAIRKRLEEEVAAQMKELEHQKRMYQQTNVRISESVAYAEKIQHSIMPPPEDLEKYPIQGGFIFYSPLDVVSGDFYWFTQKGNYLIVCCADCTGHGIPGGFMSMISAAIINNIVSVSPPDVSPASILTRLDEQIIQNLSHNRTESGDAHDGLDTAIVSINLKTHLMRSAAARRPIYVTLDQDITELKATKRSIGDIVPGIREREFKDQEVQMREGDCIYMFSDGYSDQFGGEKKEKMKNSKIKQFLRTIHDDDMDEQSLTVQELFMQWKGDCPQIDDVLFIGIKL